MNDAPTALDAVPRALLDATTTTSPHDLTSLPGYELGKKDGRRSEREELLQELRLFLLTRDLTPDEIDHVILAFMGQLTVL